MDYFVGCYFGFVVFYLYNFCNLIVNETEYSVPLMYAMNVTYDNKNMQVVGVKLPNSFLVSFSYFRKIK